MNKDSLTIALRFLKFRPRSEFEIREKLANRKIDKAEIDKVVSVLKNNQLLNDQEFAKMWVRDRNLLKPTGSYLLRLELRKLGIANSQIDQALAEQDEAELAKKALEMKYRERDIEYEKKFSFLQRRGFNTSIIYKLLKLNPKS